MSNSNLDVSKFFNREEFTSLTKILSFASLLRKEVIDDSKDKYEGAKSVISGMDPSLDTDNFTVFLDTENKLNPLIVCENGSKQYKDFLDRRIQYLPLTFMVDLANEFIAYYDDLDNAFSVIKGIYRKADSIVSDPKLLNQIFPNS